MKPRTAEKICRAALLSCAAVAIPLVAFAQANSTWEGTGTVSAPTTGSWDLNTNWSPTGVPDGHDTTILTFGGSGTTPYTSTHDLGNFKVGTIIFNSTATVTETITGDDLDRNGSEKPFTLRQDNSGSFLVNNTLGVHNENLTLSGNGSGRVTLAGVIRNKDANASRTLSLVKSGTSTFALTGTNTYTGTTTISGGTLSVNGRHTGTGAYTVQSGGTLAGTGSISAAVTVQSGGTVAPGQGVGSISTGAFTLQSGGKLLAELDFSNTTSDAVFASGGVSLAGNLEMVFLNAGGSLSFPKTFVLIHTLGSNTRTGTFASIIPASGVLIQYTVNYSHTADGDGQANDVAVTFTAVPEPGAGMLLAASVSVLARRRRRMTVRTGELI